MSLFTDTLRQSFIQMSTAAKLMLVLLLVLFFLIIGLMFAAVLAVPLFGFDLNALSTILDKPDASSLGIIKFFQIIQTLFLFLVPALLAAWLFSTNAMVYLKADRGASLITLGLIFASLCAAVPLMNFLTVLNMRLDLPEWLSGLEYKIKTMEENAGELTELFLAGNTTTDLAVNFLMIAILPALGEEFLFRGVLQRLFTDWTKNSHTGVILAAFLFSFFHFQFYGFLPRFLLGLYFGYLLVWSSSIWVPVTGHLINNGIAVIYYHFALKPMGETPMDQLGTGNKGNYMLYLSVFFTVMLIGIIYLHEKQDKRNPA